MGGEKRNETIDGNGNERSVADGRNYGYMGDS